MNPKERFVAALNHQEVDRPPVVALATGITVHMMEDAGIFYPDANHTVEGLVGLAAAKWEHGHIENIKLPFGMTVEAEVLGCEIDFGTHDTLPTDIRHIFNHPDELEIPADFLDRARVPVVLEAIRQLHEKYQDTVPIVTSIVGPWALGAKLFGFDNLFPWTITNPDHVHAVLEKLTDLAILYSNAQLEAGSDCVLLGEATCSGDLISAETYQEFILPYHKRMCAGINGPNIMHICGASTFHVPHILESGTNGYSFDEGAYIEMITDKLKGKSAIVGYVPTVEVLLYGTAEDTYKASLECIARGVDMLAPGCSVPQHTPRENVAAMVQAAKDWGEKPEVRENVEFVIENLSPAAKRAAERYAEGPKPARKRRRSRQ